MAHKTLVGGTAYEISGGKTLVGGTAYEISGGKTLVGGTGYELSFSNGNRVGGLSVGSIVKMNVSSIPTEFIVVHQGKPSNLYDDSCNGTWLLSNLITTTIAWHSSNSNKYGSSTLHSYLNGTLLNTFDAGIRDLIATVKVPYVNGTGSGGSVVSGSNGLSTKLFVLSCYEIGWVQSGNTNIYSDGECLSYFQGFANEDSRRIGYHQNGVAYTWWLRTPVKSGTNYVWTVNNRGGISQSQCVNSNTGLRMAMILPSNACVDDNFNVIV